MVLSFTQNFQTLELLSKNSNFFQLELTSSKDWKREVKTQGDLFDDELGKFLGLNNIFEFNLLLHICRHMISLDDLFKSSYFQDLYKKYNLKIIEEASLIIKEFCDLIDKRDYSTFSGHLANLIKAGDAISLEKVKRIKSYLAISLEAIRE